MDVLPLKADVVFKAVFLDEMDLLASLLTSILNLEIKPEDITVTNTELPAVHEKGKLSRMDLRVKLSDGRQINVEIQLNDEDDMEKRNLFYLSRLYTGQMTESMRYKDICPAVAVNILDFVYLPGEKYHTRFRMKEVEDNYELTDVFESNYIELAKLPPGMSADPKDVWMKLIAADSEEVLEMIAKQSKLFDKAVSKLIYVSADEQLRYEYEMREKAELDYQSAMKTSFDRGVGQGIQQGMQQGIQQANREVALKMKNEGFDDAIIRKLLGLSADEMQ
jgi:predicted transposase/invertase (TIGR01784 family)